MRESKKLKNENNLLNNSMLELVKRANEFEVLVKQSKSTILEREDRIKWIEHLHEEEEKKHKDAI